MCLIIRFRTWDVFVYNISEWLWILSPVLDKCYVPMKIPSTALMLLFQSNVSLWSFKASSNFRLRKPFQFIHLFSSKFLVLEVLVTCKFFSTHLQKDLMARTSYTITRLGLFDADISVCMPRLTFAPPLRRIVEPSLSWILWEAARDRAHLPQDRELQSEQLASWMKDRLKYTLNWRYHFTPRFKRGRVVWLAPVKTS